MSKDMHKIEINEEECEEDVGMLRIEIPGIEEDNKSTDIKDITESKSPKKKHKSGAVTEFYGDQFVSENYFGTDVIAEENRVDKDFFLQYVEENKKATPKHSSSDSRSIIPQTVQDSESKSSKKLKKEDKLNEYALAEKLAEEYTIGMYSGMCFIRMNGLCEQLSRKNTMIALGDVLSKNQRQQLTTRMSEGVYKWISSLPNVIKNKLEIPQSRVLFKNGLFDVLTGERTEIDKSDLVTFRINANFKPHKHYETPEWDEFLHKCSCGRRDVKELIMTFLGYLLLPGAPAKNFFVLGTAPDSGKSLLAEFVRRLVSEEAVCAIPIDDFNNDFIVSQVVGKAINFAMDIPGGIVSRKSVSALKVLTGRDLITINAKYEYPSSYRNFAKLVFASNDMITIRENDAAFWERMVIVPFLNSVPEEEQDPTLLDKLWEERNGIVNKAIFYAKKLIDNGYQFPCCRTAEIMKSNWISGRCPGLASFINDCCVFDAKKWCATMEMYNLYNQHCRKTGREPANVQVFSQTLCGAYGLKSVRHSVDGTQYRGIEGIAMKNV